LIFGSVCSGISSESVAWKPLLGWSPAWFSEIAAFPSAVLAHHYPRIPNLGDANKIHEKAEFKAREIDVLVGGTPCQSFSQAGGREGFGDPRGRLALRLLEIAEMRRPRWVVWENVPDVLSSNGGKDFGALLWKMGKLGYGYSWQILDARDFGLAQSRRRVFLVGYLGDWKRAAAVIR
jgi:DNA (cytosine-5)-methyltransferase 1